MAVGATVSLTGAALTPIVTALVILLLPVQTRGTDVAEERRLFYVGLTRAREEVVLFRARTRPRYGKRQQPAPSPFVGELPSGLLVEEDVEVPRQDKRATQLSLF